MSEHDLPELDPDLRALLDLESELVDPPEGAFERVFERMGHSLLDPPPDSGGDGSPSSDATPSSGPGASPAAPASPPTGLSQAATTATATTAATLSLPAVAALAFVLGIGAGVVGTRVLGPEPTPRVEERVVERIVEVPVRVVETVYVHDDAGTNGAAADPTDATDPTVGAASDGRPVPTRALAVDAGAAVGSEPAASRDHDLADENALVSRAQAALARGRTSEALAATAEHQRRFPRGEFVEEREALAIQALARSGNVPAATARAERFRTRYPRSMLLRAVNAAVGGSGSAPSGAATRSGAPGGSGDTEETTAGSTP